MWPGSGTIDWPSTAKALQALATPPATVLEISYSLPEAHATLPDQVKVAFALFD
jgi:hypothetical protein